MKTVKQDLLALIEQVDPDAKYLSEKSWRTNLFLGSVRKGMSDPAFSRLGNETTNRCLISQLFDRWYGRDRASERNGELLHFECMRYDCMFYREKDFNPEHGFPESWEYDWLIEVENDFDNEFVMTQMGLLDIVCNHRLGIYFTDERDLTAISSRFKKPWQTHVARHPFVKDFELSALLLPTTFQSTDQYTNSAVQIHWNAANGQFVALA